MPEIAELRLSADYINRYTKDLPFNRIRKNPVHKGREVPTPFSEFYISAKSRGKEILLKMTCAETGKTQSLLMTMGMAGFFQFSNTEEVPKHAHLMFDSPSEVTLSFVDIRRFGKWKLQEDWGAGRGPDPIDEYTAFVANVLDNLEHADFRRPIHEVLMNQKWFNGIGNYLRAEILYRVGVDPFLTAWDAIFLNPEMLELCRDVPLAMYHMGGGQLKDWKNPFGESHKELEGFIQCYRNPKMLQFVDRNNRTLWYDSKWRRK